VDCWATSGIANKKATSKVNLWIIQSLLDMGA
jgi:hypothetical protein